MSDTTRTRIRLVVIEIMRAGIILSACRVLTHMVILVALVGCIGSRSLEESQRVRSIDGPATATLTTPAFSATFTVEEGGRIYFGPGHEKTAAQLAPGRPFDVGPDRSDPE